MRRSKRVRRRLGAIEPLEMRAMLHGAALDLIPDFTLNDVNPTSPTFDQAVSPRGHIGTVTGWYFGHST